MTNMMVMVTIEQANELKHLRHQVTEVQARNSKLEVANRRLTEDVRVAAEMVQCAERMCAGHRADIDSMHDIIDAPDSEVERLEAEVEAMARQVHETLYELASVTMSRDALASSSVPPELARLYREAQRSLAKHHVTPQRWKLSEECGEFVAAWCKDAARTVESEIRHEIHDVLTVALSLCEPALMAKAAERLEGRLAK